MRILISFVFLFTHLSLLGFDYSVKAKQLNNSKGLSQLTVTSIAEDDAGFIWLGTQNGLNKFDGLEVKNYPLYEREVLANNHIVSVHNDTYNNLYTLTQKTLHQYIKNQDRFQQIELIIALKESETFSALETVDENLIILGTNQGRIYIHNLEDKQTIAIENSNQLQTSLWINEFDIDDKNHLWVATNQGLYKANLDSMSQASLELVSESHLNYFVGKPIQAISVHNNRLFIAGYLGFFDFNMNSKELIKVNVRDLDNNPNKIRFTSLYIKNQTIYLASLEGFYQYQVDSRSLKNIPLNNDNLKLPRLKSVFVDSNNNVWLGSEFHGALYFNISQYSLGLVDAKLQSKECLSSNSVYQIESFEDILVIPVWGKGFHIIHPDGLCEFFDGSAQNDFTRYAVRSIISVKILNSEIIWFGTSGAGAFKYDINSKTIEHITKSKDKNKSLIHVDVLDIESDTSGNLWFATKGGLSQFNTEIQQTQHFSRGNNIDLHSDEISTLYFDNENQILWLGHAAGVQGLRTNNNTGNYEIFDVISNVINNKVGSLHVDSKGQLWIGTSAKGLFVIRNGEVIKHLNLDNGLIDNKVYALEEIDGFIYGSTNQGIFRVSVDDFSLASLNEVHGLQGQEFTPASTTLNNSGKVVFAGLDGINIIDTQTAFDEIKSNRPMFTGFLKSNQPVSLLKNTEYTNGKSIFTADSLELSYTDKLFSLEFIAPNFFQPELIRYRYKLTGFEDNWIETSHKYRLATFTNLNPGNYQLIVNSSDIHGNWTDKKVSLNITMHPPIWLTWWAKVIYALTFISLTYLAYRLRIHSLRKRSEFLESEVDKRTHELALEKQTVERLLQHKNEEFANVSHEFRTPLTLVLGPIKSLLKNNIEQPVRDKLEVVKRNSYRLMRMVDQLLYMEKARVEKQVQRKSIHLPKLITHISQSFRDLSEEKGIELHLLQNDDLWLSMTPDAIEKILLNLLSNAIKYSNSGGRINVSSRRLRDNSCELTITDTGIGIPEDKLTAIFDRYQRVMNEHSEKVTGAGIGLSLVKELVEEHGGTIVVKSEENVGSSFTIKLPTVEAPQRNQERDVTLLDEAISMELESLQESLSATIEQDPNETLKPLDNTLDTVLIIEDNPDMRAYIQETLSEQFHCIMAENGQKGIDYAIEYIPDLIVSDVMMPEKDGFEVTNILKEDERTSHIPIILLTARGDKQSRMTGWKNKADEYLTKPFDEDELQIRVENLLGIRKILQHRFITALFNSPQLPTQLPDETSSARVLADEKEQAFLQKLNSTLEDIYSDPDLNLKQMASNLAISERQLQRKLKAVVDYTPNEYLRVFRLNKARDLILAGQKITAVAFEVGFKSSNYFSTCFKAHFGTSPSEV